MVLFYSPTEADSIFIPDGVEFALYTKYCFVNSDGSSVAPSPDARLHGDLVIETPSMKYVFTRLVSPQRYLCSIVQQFEEAVRRKDQIVMIDLDEAGPWECGMELAGEFRVITKNRTEDTDDICDE